MIAAGGLAAGEIVTMGFFLGPLAIAAVIAALVALTGVGLPVQLLVFIVASAASLAFLRPIASRHMRTPGRLKTGTAALVGERALVLERVDANGGSVKIGGEVWSARSFDEDEAIEPGKRVEVMQIQGATALVCE